MTMLQASEVIFLVFIVHGMLWIKTGEGLWYWLAAAFTMIRRAEITTYRWIVPAARAWWDEFMHFQERAQ